MRCAACLSYMDTSDAKRPNTAVPWTTSLSTLLGVLDSDSPLQQKAVNLGLAPVTREDGVAGVKARRWRREFADVYVELYPQGNSTWQVRAWVIRCGEPGSEGHLAASIPEALRLLALVDYRSGGRPTTHTIDRHSPRETSGDALGAGENVLDSAAQLIQTLAVQETFRDLVEDNPGLVVTSARLQPGWRSVTGTWRGMRLQMDIGRRNPSSYAEVRIGEFEVFVLPLSGDLHLLSDMAMAGHALREAVRAIGQRLDVARL